MGFLFFKERRLMRFLILVSLFVLLLPQSSNAEDNVNPVGESKTWTDNFIDELFVAAKKGDLEAQYALGALYRDGLEVEQSYEKAFGWFEKAASLDYSLAQFSLGLLYDNGQGVEQNYETAFHWYEKAAKQGHPEAQYYLGLMYRDGHGVEENHLKAMQWFDKADSNGIKRAKGALDWTKSKP